MPKKPIRNNHNTFPGYKPNVQKSKESLKDTLAKHAGRAAVGTIAASALFNALGAKSPIHIEKAPTPDTTKTVSSQEYKAFDPSQELYETNTMRIGGNEASKSDTQQKYSPDFVAQALGPEHEKAIVDYMQGIYEVLDHDPTARVTIRVRGLASDEAQIGATSERGDDLGVPSKKNQQLANDRGDLASGYAESLASTYGDRLVFETLEGQEGVLNADELTAVEAIAEAHGLTTDELTAQYNQGELGLSEDEGAVMNSLFNGRRGAIFESTIIRTTPEVSGMPEAGACDVFVRQVITQHEVTQPGDSGWRIDIVPFYIPLPRRKKKNEVKGEQDDSLLEDRSEGEQQLQSETIELQPREDEQASPEDKAGDKSLVDRFIDKATSGPKVKSMSELERMSSAERSRYFTDQQRQQRMKVAKIGGAIALGLLAVPFLSHEKSGGEIERTDLQCTSVEVQAPGHESWGLRFPVIEAVGKVFGKQLDTHISIDSGDLPESTRTTIKEHDTYIFDADGKLTSKRHTPTKTVSGHVADNPADR